MMKRRFPRELRGPPSLISRGGPARFPYLQEQDAVAVKMLHEAVNALGGVKAARAVVVALLDHPTIHPSQLEEASNLLGRAAHERARK